MKHLLIISSIFILLAWAPAVVNAQLITDSDRKLKTETKEKKGGFFGFLKKNNKRSSSGPAQQGSSFKGTRSASGSPFASFNQRKKGTPRYTQADRSSLFRSKSTAPRYSSRGLSLFNQRSRVAPRYSPGSPYSNRDNLLSKIFSPDTGPRYSPPSPFSKKQRNVTPRYSPGDPFSQSSFLSMFSIDKGPRYSPAGSPFSKNQRKVTPRYSPGSPYKQSVFSSIFTIDKGPRYSSPGSPFSNKQRTVSPRYSPGSPYHQNLLSNIFSPEGEPRYSPGSPFSKKQRTVTPRYSPGSPFDKSMLMSIFSPGKEPRYSPGSPFDNAKWQMNKPRYSTNRNRFDVDERMKEQSRHENIGPSKYKGSYKKDTKWVDDLSKLMESQMTANFKGGQKVPYRGDDFYKSKAQKMAAYEGNYKEKWLNKRKMHPSVAHNNANFSQEWMRESMRKWNIFLSRVNRNKVQPDAVKDSVLKPKFDRKEAKIWYE